MGWAQSLLPGLGDQLGGPGKLGFAHHGIGSNYAIGGKVLAPCHIDVIYSGATVEIDGKVILDRGKAVI